MPVLLLLRAPLSTLSVRCGHTTIMPSARWPGNTLLAKVFQYSTVDLQILECWHMLLPDLMKFPAHLQSVFSKPQESGVSIEVGTSVP